MRTEKMFWTKLTMVALMLVSGICSAAAEPLKIAYSDWPGWVAWDIAKQKGFFEKHGVEVELLWFEYGASMDAFAAGKADAVCVANGDSLVLNATGARNIMILVNDYSNGNDKIVASRGINTIQDLKGKKVGVEIGCLSHAMLIHALKLNGMSESDVTLINMPTHQAVQTLASGEVSAIVAWQPHSGMTLKTVDGSNAIFTSADAPGIIYDTLTVSPSSLMTRRAEWNNVIDAWYDVIEFMNDPANEEEALQILSARVGISAAEYKTFMTGTRFLTRNEALDFMIKSTDGLDSLKGSSEIIDRFLVANKVYDTPVNTGRIIDSSLTKNNLDK